MIPILSIPYHFFEFEVIVGKRDETNKNPIACLRLSVRVAEQEKVLAVYVEPVVRKRKAADAVLYCLEPHGVRILLLPGIWKEVQVERTACFAHGLGSSERRRSVYGLHLFHRGAKLLAAMQNR